MEHLNALDFFFDECIGCQIFQVEKCLAHSMLFTAFTRISKDVWKEQLKRQIKRHHTAAQERGRLFL